MDHNRGKTIYGNFKLAKPAGKNSTKASKNSILSAEQHAKSGDLFDERANKIVQQHRRSLQLQSAPVRIHSLPRTILKLSIVGLIFQQGLVQTQIGKGLANNAAQKITEFQKKIMTTLSELDPQNRSKNRQKAVDDHFYDAWKRAGGESDKKD
jgi:hypothetical protein